MGKYNQVSKFSLKKFPKHLLPGKYYEKYFQGMQSWTEITLVLQGAGSLGGEMSPVDITLNYVSHALREVG